MKTYDYIFTGGGLSALLVLKEMASHREFYPKKILVIDNEAKNLNDRTWCFWDSKQKFQNLSQHYWKQIQFKSSLLNKKIDIYPYKYYKIESKTLYETLKKEITQELHIDFIVDKVIQIKENELAEVVTEKTVYHTTKVFNSILMDFEFKNSKKFPLVQQHFIGWFIKTKTPAFDESLATFMDFSIPQKENTRFMYVLPTSSTEALFEYTLFSADLLKEEEYEEGIKSYLLEKGINDYEIVEKECGNIPMTCYPFWKKNTEKIIQIGTVGGWTKASTGFTFKKAHKKSIELVQILQNGKSIKNLNFNKKFLFFDLLLIDILFKKNELGSVIFESIFRKQKASLVLKFLDEETSLLEDLKIIWSCPKLPFIKALINRIF